VTTDLGFTHRWDPREGATRTLLLLHGTGGDENDLIPLGDLLDPTANVLSPRGPVMENGMPRFFRRLAEGVFDLEDLHARTDQLADFISAAASQYGFDPATLTAVGFSNGANIAASVMLQRPKALRSAILLRAMLPFEPETPPDLKGARVFLAAGRADPIIPAANVERLARMLAGFGAEMTLEWIPVGHQLTRADVDAAKGWLDG
jgi:phospholipase/carboxylesterase